MSIRKVGPWNQAARILRAHASRFDVAVDRAIAREAQLYAKMIKEGIRNQAPGGVKFQPLSPITIFLKGSSKALIDKGDLFNSVKATKITPKAWFVGVHRTATSQDGQRLANIAEIHEFGKDFFQVVTDAQHRFFLFLKASGKINRAPRVGQRIHIRIPKRSFVAPVFARLSPGSPKRIVGDIIKFMGIAQAI